MLKRRAARRSRGLTAIEILISITIIAILLSAALPNFASWQARVRVRNAAEAIYNGIQLARVEAVTRNARTRFTLQADGGWTVRCVTAGIASGCNDTAVLHARSGAEGRGVETMNVNGAAASGTSTLDFNAIGRPDTSMTGWISAVDVAAPTAVDAVNEMRAYRVQVTPFGRIRLCQPFAASGSVTRC
jgi:type IV fimbrial biogenesis protein FimT